MISFTKMRTLSSTFLKEMSRALSDATSGFREPSKAPTKSQSLQPNIVKKGLIPNPRVAMMLFKAPLISSRSSATSAARASPVWRRTSLEEVGSALTFFVAALTALVIPRTLCLKLAAAAFFSALVLVGDREAAVSSR